MLLTPRRILINPSTNIIAFKDKLSVTKLSFFFFLLFYSNSSKKTRVYIILFYFFTFLQIIQPSTVWHSNPFPLEFKWRKKNVILMENRFYQDIEAGLKVLHLFQNSNIIKAKF